MTPQEEPTLEVAGQQAMERCVISAGGHYYDLDSLEGRMALSICMELQKHHGSRAEYEYSRHIIPDVGPSYEVQFKGHLAAVQDAVARATCEECMEEAEGVRDAVSLMMRKVMSTTHPFIPELTITEEIRLAGWLNSHQLQKPIEHVELKVTIKGEDHEDTV